MKSKTKEQKRLPQNHYREGIISINNRGFGVFKDDENIIEIDPLFINNAYHGDYVKILIHPKIKNKIKKGEVVEIIKRSKDGFAGILKKENNIYFVFPDDNKMYKDIIIPIEKLNGANIEEKVFVKIIDWGKHKESPIGEIYKILGKPNENETEMQAIALEKGFDPNFPKNVKEESQKIKERGITNEDLKNRKDLRNILTFTIDPEDAKDFDDAISFEYLKNNNFEIGIHIADVSHYVKIKSDLDIEARKRGTSVYLVDRTIPMLPEELSNDLCSLKPEVDRLTVSAIFEIDESGKIYKEWFGRTIINSNKRFTYEEAEEILKNKKGLFFKELDILNKIAKKLFKKRYDEGAISLEQEEVKFKLDENKIPIGVFTKVRGDSNKMIEELMLLANKQVATFMSKDKKGDKNMFVYRIHDLPNKEKMKDLVFFLKKIGFQVKLKNNIIPGKDINELLEKLKDHPIKNTIHNAIIRTMAKAIYSTKNIGHYGLGFKYYTHFTSPIRRYPDVLVHRLLLDFIKNKKFNNKNWSLFEKMSLEASQREKEASEAERNSIKYKQVEYMSQKIGESYIGNITHITDWGIYVEEEKTKCEGMVSVRDLKDDYYIFDQKQMTLRGSKKNKKYTLGDKVKFKVESVDLDKKNINYILI